MIDPNLSIIIPTINEESSLKILLPQIFQQKNISFECLVCDGGSTDHTKMIAQQLGAIFIPCPKKGRGHQMNQGAQKAKAPYFLFLHADSLIEDPHMLERSLLFLKEQEKIYSPQLVAGHFSLKFITSSSKKKFPYFYMEQKTFFSDRAYTINGDQGFLMSRKTFFHLNGFDETFPFLEDQNFAERFRKIGVWVTLPYSIKTSARRFEKEGFSRRYTLMSIMMGLYWTGNDSFFYRAKNIYADQSQTQKLRMTPFFQSIWEMMKEDLGFKGSLKAWTQVGNYICQNAWQLFFFGDICIFYWTNKKKFWLLKFYDKVIFRHLNCQFMGIILAFLSFFWFMGVLYPSYWILELKLKRSPH